VGKDEANLYGYRTALSYTRGPTPLELRAKLGCSPAGPVVAPRVSLLTLLHHQEQQRLGTVCLVPLTLTCLLYARTWFVRVTRRIVQVATREHDTLVLVKWADEVLLRCG
jgi:hypothetical protein